MGDVREEMPVLARHAGVWDGTYTLVDPLGNVLDQHRARLTQSIEGELWLQKNEYFWSDGRAQTLLFPGRVSDRRLHFDTERLIGEAWEVGPSTIILNWTYKHDPGGFLYELINLTDGDTKRARVWQHFDGHELVRLTLIKEVRVS